MAVCVCHSPEGLLGSILVAMLEEQGHEQVYSFKCSLGFCLCHACGILLINISLTKAIHMIESSDLDIERQGTAWEKG